MNTQKPYKIFIVGNDKSYIAWIDHLVEITYDLKIADVVLFTGGEDVNPALYNSQTHPTTFYTDRDIFETHMFKKAQALNKKCLGICRGAQFLCVSAGGQLIQDMSHPHVHQIYLRNFNGRGGNLITVNSLHHQMQYPYNLKPNKEFKLLGYTTDLYSKNNSSCHLSKKHVLYDIKNKTFTYNGLTSDQPEAEVVYYPKIKALAIQSHPEMISKEHNTEYINLFIEFMK